MFGKQSKSKEADLEFGNGTSVAAGTYSEGSTRRVILPAPGRGRNRTDDTLIQRFYSKSKIFRFVSVISAVTILVASLTHFIDYVPCQSDVVPMGYCKGGAYPLQLYDVGEDGYLRHGLTSKNDPSMYPTELGPENFRWEALHGKMCGDAEVDFLRKTVEYNGNNETRYCPPSALSTYRSEEDKSVCHTGWLHPDYLPDCSPDINDPPCSAGCDGSGWVVFERKNEDGSCYDTQPDDCTCARINPKPSFVYDMISRDGPFHEKLKVLTPDFFKPLMEHIGLRYAYNIIAHVMTKNPDVTCDGCDPELQLNHFEEWENYETNSQWEELCPVRDSNIVILVSLVLALTTVIAFAPELIRLLKSVFGQNNSVSYSALTS